MEEKDRRAGMDDGSLLQAIAQGSKAAFQACYERHAKRLMGYMLRLTGDRALAEDIVQEVFVAVWLKASTYRPEQGAPMGWLYMIARHKLVDRWRRQPPPDEATRHELERSLTELVQEDATLALSVERALDGLGSAQRKAIELAFLGGHTHEEAAAALDVPLGTLKSRIRMALAHMRQMLTEATS